MLLYNFFFLDPLEVYWACILNLQKKGSSTLLKELQMIDFTGNNWTWDSPEIFIQPFYLQDFLTSEIKLLSHEYLLFVLYGKP